MEDIELSGIGNIGDFLDKKLIDCAQDRSFPYNEVENKFNKTFEYLNTTLGEGCIKRYDEERDKFKGGFSISAYESVAFGIAYHIEKILKIPSIKYKLIDRIKKINKDTDFIKWTGDGKSSESRIKRSVPIGRKYLKP